MPGARGTGMDIKHFCVNTNLDGYEQIWVPENMSTKDIQKLYKLDRLIHNGRVLVEIRKGMYVLPQAGILIHKKIKKHLTKYGYFPCKQIPGRWQHESKNVIFTLIIDGVAVKYQPKQDAGHLLQSIAMYTK